LNYYLKHRLDSNFSYGTGLSRIQPWLAALPTDPGLFVPLNMMSPSSFILTGPRGLCSPGGVIRSCLAQVLLGGYHQGFQTICPSSRLPSGVLTRETQPLRDIRPQGCHAHHKLAIFSFNLLGIFFTNTMVFRFKMTFISTPIICVKTRDSKGF